MLGDILNTEPIFYSVNNAPTTSKVQALTWANWDRSSVKFHYRDNEWDNINWTIEPTEEWDTLLVRRCQEIRNNFSHISLWYSGGYDSHTILMAFVKNNILIDELFIYGRDYLPEDNRNVGEKPYALALAEEIKKLHYPKIKITEFNFLAANTIDFYTGHPGDWMTHPGESLWFSKTSRGTAYTMYDELKSRAHNENSCQIVGLEKPRLDLRNNKWFVSVPDVATQFEIGVPANHISFFSGDPLLYLKQVWMMIRWLEMLPGCLHEFVHRLQSHRVSPLVYRDWNLAIGRYDLTTEFAINGGFIKRAYSGVNSLESKKLEEFLVTTNNSVYRDVYLGGIADLEKIAGPLSSGLGAIMSTPRFIKNLSNENNI